ncbi:uncharacterized protein LOC112514605 [Cynara cardunculus var. scolymus]|uniref:FLZ-type domain-containing protein n=1 Tax=Cynara cardunculus var. scolymus TaxID=59895 RepID=A0A103XZ40_CYNCS|nr:uncharacterized protein LOC112514605 [Cynara cardunculus var. scolymus]KVH99557.1 Protein of unknown function DUF581 [Cynara cardunculus var. scolymus]
MILGKRPRPPIKRTTSMTEVTLDLNRTAVGGGHANSQPPYDPNNPFTMNPSPDANLDHRFFTPTISPRNHRRNSADHMESAHFLTVCHLCNRRLITGRDIFMYRGDSAFCSSECRQEQMNQDEKKDKHPLVPKKPAAIISESSS